MPRLAAFFALVLSLLLVVRPAAAQAPNPDDPVPPGAKSTILPLKATVEPLKPTTLPLKATVLEIRGAGGALKARVGDVQGALKDLGAKVTPEEIKMGQDYLRDARNAMKETNVPVDQQPRAALASYARVLLSSNEFLYVD